MNPIKASASTIRVVPLDSLSEVGISSLFSPPLQIDPFHAPPVVCVVFFLWKGNDFSWEKVTHDRRKGTPS